MNSLVGPGPEIYFTVMVKRAVTGKEETYHMIGTHMLPLPVIDETLLLDKQSSEEQ